MNFYSSLAEANNWLFIWPELSLVGLALTLMGVDLFTRDRYRVAYPIIAAVGQLIILIGMYCSHFVPKKIENFAGLIYHTPLSSIMGCFFLLSSILVCAIAGHYLLDRSKLHQVEFFVITLLATAGAMLLVKSNHFIMLFVALEVLTISSFILVAYNRESSFSLEAGLKFLILGALSSAILLMGIVLLYGIAGNPNLLAHTKEAFSFIELKKFITLNAQNPLVLVGSGLVLCGIAFKIGLFPFQIWIPDVYQGAPNPTTAFLAISSKAAGFIVLINLMRGPFEPLYDTFYPLFVCLGGITLLFGSITALSQTNVKRLVGLSGVSHAGYLMLGVITIPHVEWAVSAIVFYLFAYLLGSFCVFFTICCVNTGNDHEVGLENYENLIKRNPLVAVVLAIGLGSLAGIPPLAGFIGKFLLFLAAFKAKLFLSLAIAIIGVVISIYYYFGWIREAWFSHTMVKDDEPVKKLKVGTVGVCLMSLLVFATIFLGINQSWLTNVLF